jgi:hypothetical protein
VRDGVLGVIHTQHGSQMREFRSKARRVSLDRALGEFSMMMQ